ncbi:unnamed protein product [Symbiodinium microadriaticum]|nr:unnamed protein product [Symbiodinium sp. KB8]CAE7334232.1 unnamed protein product [Symbiodinium microadriaticum]
MQRMLKSACRDAASLTEQADALNAVATSLCPEGQQLRPAVPAAQPKPQAAQPCQQPLPADEGAGSYPPEPSLQTAQTVQGPEDAVQEAAPTVHHEEITNVSNEVLRLRLLKSQHEELKSQLSRAEAQLRRLSPHAVFQLRSYLEKNLREPSLAMQVQEAIVRLMQCLLAIFKVEVPSLTAEALLSGARKLFRDPHSFTSKLCGMAAFSSDEAKKLAPFLTSGSQFRRVREKEVNECYEALHGWLSAFYTYSSVSDQVVITVQQLEKQEWLLRRLNNQAMDLLLVPAVPSSSASVSGGVPAPQVASTFAAVSARTSQPVPSHAKAASSARVTASPLTRSRRGLQGFPAGPTALRPALGRSRATAAWSSEIEGTHSRSQSPVQGSGSSRVSARPRAISSVAFGSPAMVSARSKEATSPAKAAATAPLGRARADTACGIFAGSASVEGLARVHSDKALTRSPRTVGRHDSRSPSPGTGRASPSVPQRMRGPPQTFKVRRDTRPISPSASEGVISTAQRMVSAPTELASRSVAVRTSKTSVASARVSSTRHSATAPPGRGQHSLTAKPAALRQGSPDKGGGAPRDAGVEPTPRALSQKHPAVIAKRTDDSGPDDSDGEEPRGPHRRQLSEKQYEALVRCAQQVVALSGAGSGGLLAAPAR